MSRGLEPVNAEEPIDLWWEYRIASGRIVNISRNVLVARDSLHAVVQNPTITLAEGDTQITRETYLVSGTEVRKATAGELATFATVEAADKITKDKTDAKNAIVTRRDLMGVLELMRQELNICRAGLTTPQPARTKQQALNALNNIIDSEP